MSAERTEFRPDDPVPAFLEVRRLIEHERYAEALDRYYAILGPRDCGECHHELLYLKRVAAVPLTGRDLMCFAGGTLIGTLIAQHQEEYRKCIDEAIDKRLAEGTLTPTDILMARAPTLAQAIERRKHLWHDGVFLYNGQVERDVTDVTAKTLCWTNDHTCNGRLFEVYPDPVACCQIVEYPRDKRYRGLWITYTREFVQREVLDRGWFVRLVDAFGLVAWRGLWERAPDFTTAHATAALRRHDCGTEGIEYTGRTHKIEGTIFHEVDLIRFNMDSAATLCNPFLDAVRSVLRDAENLFRTRHGLPPIGEIGVSEALLFVMVQQSFPDAQRRVTFPWLSPQHVDIWIPSAQIAIEYQGPQHYQPVAFFGGVRAMESTALRDRAKAQKCANNGVILIYWRHDEPITEDLLAEKIETAISQLPPE